MGLRATAAGSAIDGLAEAAAGALGKVERVLLARLRPQVEAVATATVPLVGERGGIDAQTLVTIARACRGAERLRLGYEDRQGRRSERTVEPYRLVYTGWRWYLVARDVRAHGWRTLRVDRIDGAVATGHTFVLDDPPDAAALVFQGVAVAPYRHRARVVVHAPPDEVARLVRPTVATIETLDDPDRCLLVTGATISTPSPPSSWCWAGTSGCWSRGPCASASLGCPAGWPRRRGRPRRERLHSGDHVMRFLGHGASGAAGSTRVNSSTASKAISALRTDEIRARRAVAACTASRTPSLSCRRSRVRASVSTSPSKACIRRHWLRTSLASSSAEARSSPRRNST